MIRCRLPRIVALAVFAGAGAGAGCDESAPLADKDLALTIIAGDEVEFGRAFPLTVERQWSVDLAPEAWRDEALAPLRVVPLATGQRSDGRRILETRSFRAYSFLAGRVALPAVAFHATDRSGTSRSVASAPIRFDVRPAVADAASEVERPDELLLPPSPLTPLRMAVAAALLLLALLAAWLVRRRSRRDVGAAAIPGPTPGVAPRERALARLARLRASDPEGAAALQEFHVEAAALLKEFVAERFGMAVLERTTEEIAAVDGASPVALAPAQRAALAHLLAPCDRVKFARATSDRAARAEWVDGAVRFVEAAA